MKKQEKKLLSIALITTSVSGIVAPLLTAMATVVEDEENATEEQLKSVINEYSIKLEQNPIFANYHRVRYAAERLAKYDEQYANNILNSIAKYDSKVYTEDIINLVDKMSKFAESKEMKIYDDLINNDIPLFENTDKESADYLMSRLDVWGKGVVFEVDPNYSKATDEIIKVNLLREEDKLQEALNQVEVAKEAIKHIVTYNINGEYLERKLKIEEHKVENDIAEKDLYVRKVSLNNGREIEVKFNKGVSESSAEDINNYSFKSINSSSKDINIEDIQLQQDGCTVIIKVKEGLNSNINAMHIASIKNIITNDGKEMKDYYEILNIYDDHAPEVENVKYIDDNRIMVDFSEPINATEDDIYSSVKIKYEKAKIPLSIYAFELDKNKKYFILDLSKTNIDRNDKNYTLEIDGLTDYAGNLLIKYSDDLLIKKDKENPRVNSITSISKNVFRVQFSEKIYDDIFKVMVNGQELVLKKGENLQVINEDDDNVIEGQYDVTLPKSLSGLYNLITIYDYKDLYKNKGDSITKEVYFKEQHPVLKNTTPRLKMTLSKTYQVLTFDKDVNLGEAEEDRIVQVKHTNSDGVTITDNIPLVDKKDLDAKLENNEIGLDITNLEEGKYTFDLQPRNIVDNYNQNIEKISLKFYNSTQYKTGKVINVIPNDPDKQSDEKHKENALNKVIVEFDKEVEDDAKNPNKYTIDNKQVFKKAIFIEDKKHVELTLKKDALSTSGKKNFKVQGINNVKDYDNDIDFKDNTKPKVERVDKIGLNTIRIVMSEDIKKDITINKDDIKIKTDGNNLSNDIKVTGQGTDILFITLSKEDTLTSSRDKVTLEILDDNRICDEEGNNVEVGIIEDVGINLDSLLVEAINKVEDLRNACKEDLAVLENLDKAKKAREAAQKAVDDLENSPDKINLQNEINEQSKIIEEFY
ncbi:hypothetical protein [Clostridium frigidicarnis]|uniref:Uncharacterized protein n=1 Tax=Clostridium frigidicarnis TaxID=84698 RepID=A0A1I0VZ40_9CLOT|nr:hypothetical protein [Clostridium frigidicarnis]SFA81200.1 hypothetical protein SAMN04488528_1003113 [Clostridium frigidicarnis]